MSPSSSQKQNEIITPEKLVDIFSLFALGTISVVLLIQLPKESSMNWWNGLLSALNILVIFSYIIVTYYLIAHYMTRGKEKLLIHLKDHRKEYGITMFFTMCVLYIAIEFLSKGFIDGIRAILIVVITILATVLASPLSKWISNFIDNKLRGNNKKKNKKSKNT